MKRFLTLAAIAAVILSAISCRNQKPVPELEFSKNLYTIFAKGNTDIVLIVNEVQEKDLSIPLKFSGSAEKGTDYTVSSETITIPAGGLAGSINLTDISLSKEKQVSVSFDAPAGYKQGNKFSAVVAAESQEALAYSFNIAENVVLESYIAKLTLTGTTSGNEFKAETDIKVPLTFSGGGQSLLQYESFIKIPAGSNEGRLELKMKDPNFTGNTQLTVTVNRGEAPRLIPGDNKALLLHVRGKQTPDKLVGTWKFNRTMGLNELEEWYGLYSDDVALLPTHNQDFTLKFAKEGDGSVKLIPGANGDFANYFAEAKITLAEPVNPCSNHIKLGDNTTEENHMFVASDKQDGNAYMVFTYYKLSKVNYAFAKDKEDYKEARIAIAITPSGKMILSLKEYTSTPPFGEELFKDYTKDGKFTFDPELMGFASLFTKE